MIQQTAVCSELLLEICKINSYFKIKGDLKISSLFLNSIDLEYFFLNSKDLFVYNSKIFPKRVFIESFKNLNNAFIIKFKNYDSIDSVKQFVNSYIMVKEFFFKTYLNSIKHPLTYIDYTVLDKNLNKIGKITNIIFSAQNRLLLDGNIELPFVKDFILNIDDTNKTISMDLPEGII